MVPPQTRTLGSSGFIRLRSTIHQSARRSSPTSLAQMVNCSLSIPPAFRGEQQTRLRGAFRQARHGRDMVLIVRRPIDINGLHMLQQRVAVVDARPEGAIRQARTPIAYKARLVARGVGASCWLGSHVHRRNRARGAKRRAAQYLPHRGIVGCVARLPDQLLNCPSVVRSGGLRLVAKRGMRQRLRII